MIKQNHEDWFCFDLPPTGALKPTTTQPVWSAINRSWNIAGAIGGFGKFTLNSKLPAVWQWKSHYKFSIGVDLQKEHTLNTATSLLNVHGSNSGCGKTAVTNVENPSRNVIEPARITNWFNGRRWFSLFSTMRQDVTTWFVCTIVPPKGTLLTKTSACKIFWNFVN